MRTLWRACAAVLVGVVLATNAMPFVALAQSTIGQVCNIDCVAGYHPSGPSGSCSQTCVPDSATSTPQTPPPSCAMSVNPSAVAPGGSVTLTWQSANATGGNITGVGPVGPSGSINLLPSTAQTVTNFIGTFTGLGGTAQCQAIVQIMYDASQAGGVSTGGSAGGGIDTTGGASAQTPAQTPAPTTPTQTGSSVTSPNGGLVPCGVASNPNDFVGATSCQACDLATLIQNIINFAIGLSIPIAAALFAYAGVLMFSSAQNPEQRTRARKIFKNAFVGFAIAVTAWLVVDTLLHVLFAQSQVIQSGSWFSIQCVSNDSVTRPRASSVTGWINSVLPTVNTTPINTGTLAPGGGSAFGTFCADGSTPSVTEVGNVCANGQPAQLAPTQTGTGDCSPTNLGDNFDTPSDVTAMSCILQKESGCNPYNTGDKTTYGTPVSIGLAQINMTNHVVQCDNVNNGQAINCPAAFSGTYTGSNKNIQVVDQQLYSQCAQALTNQDCNLQVAQGVLNTEGLKAWSTAKSCGVQ